MYSFSIRPRTADCTVLAEGSAWVCRKAAEVMSWPDQSALTHTASGNQRHVVAIGYFGGQLLGLCYAIAEVFSALISTDNKRIHKSFHVFIIL